MGGDFCVVVLLYFRWVCFWFDFPGLRGGFEKGRFLVSLDVEFWASFGDSVSLGFGQFGFFRRSLFARCWVGLFWSFFFTWPFFPAQAIFWDLVALFVFLGGG